jgi:hypothetical protein
LSQHRVCAANGRTSSLAYHTERRSDQRQTVPSFQRLRATVSSQLHFSLPSDPSTDLFALLWPSASRRVPHSISSLRRRFPPGLTAHGACAPLTNIATGLIFASRHRCRRDPFGRKGQTRQPEYQTALTLSWPGFSRSKALPLPTLQPRSNLVQFLISSRATRDSSAAPWLDVIVTRMFSSLHTPPFQVSHSALTRLSAEGRTGQGTGVHAYLAVSPQAQGCADKLTRLTGPILPENSLQAFPGFRFLGFSGYARSVPRCCASYWLPPSLKRSAPQAGTSPVVAGLTCRPQAWPAGLASEIKLSNQTRRDAPALDGQHEAGGHGVVVTSSQPLLAKKRNKEARRAIHCSPLTRHSAEEGRPRY